MFRKIVFILFALLICGAHTPPQAWAQSYVLKKESNSGGFFQRLFGNKSQENKEQKQSKKQPKKNAVPVKSAAPRPDPKALILPPYPDEPEIRSVDLQYVQDKAAGDCTPENRAIYAQFQTQFDADNESADQLSRSGGVNKNKRVRLPDPEQNEEAFRKKVVEIIPQEGLVGLMANPQAARASIMAMMKCSDWSDLAAREGEQKQRRQARVKMLEDAVRNDRKNQRGSKPDRREDLPRPPYPEYQ